jgi:hypothetical protein
MNEHSNPLDYILRCAEQGLVPKVFTVRNAKDELQRLRQELASFKESFSFPKAWARLNDRGDIYDLRILNNPYVDPKTVLPLYSNKEEFKNLMDELKNA